MAFGKMLIKLINQPGVKDALIKEVKKYNTPTTVDVTAPKTKYASMGTSQMRSGRSSTINTSAEGLLSQAKVKKNTLLGG